MIKQITCEEFAKKVQLHFEGQLDPIQEQRFIQHNKTCSKCNKLSSTYFAERTAEEGFGWIVNGGRKGKLKNCLNSSTRLEYAKDELTAEEREMVRDHIRNCSYCRGLVHAEIKVWEMERVRKKAGSKKKEERKNKKEHLSLSARY